MSKKGFTLIELLVVVIIIGVLTSIALPQYRKAMDRARAAEATQVLPAVFESRERFSLQCKSDGECPQTITLKMLDIEVPADVGVDGCDFASKNFCYYIKLGEAGSFSQACVAAKPRWGDSRGLPGAMIYYRGDKFSCAGSADACDILNVADSDHRTGCI